MSYQVLMTTAAERDILAAADYIKYALKNPAAADRLIDEAEERIASLEEMPNRTRAVDEPVLSSWGVHCISVNSYLVFYLVDDERKAVTVIRFLHQKSNWPHILRLG